MLRFVYLVMLLVAGCSRSALEIRSNAACEEAGCPVCTPDARECRGDDIWACHADGSGWDLVERCDPESAMTCEDATCISFCERSVRHPSNLGCELWSLDLDQLAAEGQVDNPHLRYGVTLANPWTIPAHVVIERNDAMPGEPLRIREVLSRVVPARDYEEIALPERELDGSDMGVDTHTALTSHAYRITSTIPIVVVQANPLESTGFSRDTSLLLPTPMLGTRTTVVGWPQTIADGDTPDTDFDSSRHDEDAPAFLTLVGTQANTHVHLRIGPMGPAPAEIVAGGSIPRLGAGDTLDVTLGAFDVLNLETRGLNADPTGTVVESDLPIAVFVGSEASDVPRFDRYPDRICCADHLEEQLWPDRYAGRYFVIGRQSSRRAALGRALGRTESVVPEPEWVRVIAIDDADLHVSAGGPSIPSHLAAGQDVVVRADASFELVVTNAGHVHVMSALPSQDVIGVSRDLPGGDPSLLLVPPVESFTREATVIVPDGSTFDFVTILAPLDATVSLDGALLSSIVGPDGAAACQDESTPRFVVHRCQLGFPTIDLAGPAPTLGDGTQHDGVHIVSADRPIGVTVSGFQNYIGYAQPGAMTGF